MASSTPVSPEAALASALSNVRSEFSTNVAEAGGIRSVLSAPPGGDGGPAEVPAAPAPQPAPAAVPVPPAAAPVPAPVAAPAVAPPPAPAAAPSAAPAAAPETPAAPAITEPEIQIPTREELDNYRATYVQGNVTQDREAQSWVGAWAENKQVLDRLGSDLRAGGKGEIAALEEEILVVQGQLKAATTENDDYEKGVHSNKLRDLQGDLRIKRLERAELAATQKELSARYDERVRAYRDQAEGNIRQHLDGLTAPKRIVAHAQAFQQVWDPAVTRVAQAKGIAPASIPRFNEYAKMVTALEIDQKAAPMLDHEVEPFLAIVADRYMAMVDEHHRAMSGQYARTAAERAAQPAPASPAGGPPAAVATNPAPSSPADILKAVYKEARQTLHAERNS